MSAPIREGCHEKAWNDPPQFGFDSSSKIQAQTSAEPKRLSGRVFANIGGTSTGETIVTHEQTRTMKLLYNSQGTRLDCAVSRKAFIYLYIVIDYTRMSVDDIALVDLTLGFAEKKGWYSRGVFFQETPVNRDKVNYHLLFHRQLLSPSVRQNLTQEINQ